MTLRQSLCPHKKYKIIQCEKNKTEYQCQCLKCNYQFNVQKAQGEMYEIGSIIKLW